MNPLYDENIGSAKDNMSCAIHNWYKFTAGFSYKLVDLLVSGADKRPMCVYEPFAGCGTTLVECQKLGIHSIGNESQQVMCDVINAKLNWDIEQQLVAHYFEQILDYFQRHLMDDLSEEYNELLVSLYDTKSLKEIYLLRNAIREVEEEKYRLFFNQVLAQVLHKASIHPIAVPYIARSKVQKDPGNVLVKFESVISRMQTDLDGLLEHDRLAMVYRHDSRLKNAAIADGCCDMCITSPPYLNNLDYGEVSKVVSHFFDYTNSWHDVTEKVRKQLVTGATTHYKDCEFSLESFLGGGFAIHNENVLKAILPLYHSIEQNGRNRRGKKSFHILMMHYFEDMYHVLQEMRRVLSPNSPAYLILGDSAPYGVYVPTTQLLGEIAMSVGFNEYSIYKIRNRGEKWTSLTYRHNLKLSENILVLK